MFSALKQMCLEGLEPRIATAPLISGKPEKRLVKRFCWICFFGSGKGPQALRTLFLLSDFRKFPKALSIRNQS